MQPMNPPSRNRDLPFTGERVVPGKTPRLLVLEHLLRYRFAAGYAGGRKVLDVGCGTGYGAAILATKASVVVGIDCAAEALEYAQANYRHPRLHYCFADCRELPFGGGFFDLAVLFEIIEHTAEQNLCLSEIRRLLSPEGMLILSTPNPAGPTKVIEEPNPFHAKELGETDLLELLRPHFDHVQLFYQHELSASDIHAGAANTSPAEVVEDFSVPTPAKYFVAVCSSQPLSRMAGRIFGVAGIEHQVAIVQDLHLTQQELAAHRQQIEALLRQREENEQEYTRNLAAHKEAIARLEKTLEEEVALRDRQLSELERQNTSRRLELEWLYRWLPLNRVARRLFYGKGLRQRLLRRLGQRA
jgi:2-polyprenyl-3-methyl-5-hydroxy-6-metoxy-1,4-benzoquinol methylase